MKLFVLILLTFSFLFAQPKPFGLELGVTTKEQALSIIRKEGGRVVNSGNRVIKGDIVNPEIEGVVVTGLPVENLQEATFWFYKGRLFKIEYTFPLSMNKEEFYVLHKQLSQKYGNPKRYVKPYLADGIADWNFGNVRMSLIAPWVSWSMYLVYEHVPTSRQADISDQEVFERETAKPRRGL